MVLAVYRKHARIIAMKHARIIAIKINEDFTVETDRGIMSGVAGDYLVTNHPDDDTTSDLWTISQAQMDATYERVV